MGGSLQEELSAALEGAELPSGDSAPVDVGAEPSGDTGASIPEESASGGTEPPGESATSAAEATAPTQNTGDQPAADPAQSADMKGAMAPPATWSAAAKAIYSQLPDVARKEIAKRERDYAMGIQQHAEKAKGYETLMQEFQPYEAMLRSEGSNPQTAIRSLLNTAYRLRSGTPQERGQLVMGLAQQFGADLSPYLGQQEQPDGQQDLTHVQQMVQQLVAPHLQKIQQFEMQQMTAQQNQAQQMEQEIQSHIEAFQSATNEDGTPKHLYFENVRPLMSAYFANGQAQTLEQAYDMACWANPEVRTALIADQQRAADAKRLDEAKRKAQDAGRAGFNVQGQGGVGIAGATSTSLRDELASQLDAQLGGARV